MNRVMIGCSVSLLLAHAPADAGPDRIGTLDGAPMHALIPAASRALPGDPQLVHEEQSVLTYYEFEGPVVEFNVVVSGVLVSKDTAEWPYADMAFHWRGSKFVGRLEADTPDRRVVQEPFQLACKLSTSEESEHIPLIANLEGGGAYSFKQNRVLIHVSGAPSGKMYRGFSMVAPAWARDYYGALRVQVFKGTATPKGRTVPRAENVDACAGGVPLRMEFYRTPEDGTDELFCLGEKLDRAGGGTKPFAGDFLHLVGADLRDGITTQRSIQGLPGAADAKLELRGCFLYSAFHPDAPFFMFGGGGGISDAWFRFDYGSAPGIKGAQRTNFPFICDAELKLYDSSGGTVPFKIHPTENSESELASPSHTYILQLKVPADGAVWFYQKDCREDKNAADNAGVLFVRWLEPD